MRWMSGKDLLAAYHVGVEVGMQNRRGDFAAALSGRFPLHGNVWSLAAPRMRQAQRTRRRHNDPRARNCRSHSAGLRKTSAP